MTPYTPDELSEVIADLHKLHEEATPVPWDNDKGVVRGPEGGPPFIRGFPPVSWQGVNGYQPKRTLDNVKLAVKARNALPRLLATLEAQAAEIERWKRAVRDAEGNPPAESSCMDEHDMVIGREAYRDGWLDAVHSIYRTANAKGTP